MRMSSLIVPVAVAFGFAAAAQTYVVDRNGNRMEGDDIVASAQGDLTIKVGAGTRELKRGQYQYVVTPRPTEVATLERLLAEKRYDNIIANADKVFEKFRFLGWGGRIAAIDATARLAKNDAAGALRVLQQASQPDIAARFADEVTRGRISALIALQRANEAAPLLQQLKSSKDDRVAAFAFLSEGQMLEQQGNKREAMLSYLKTVLLFRDGAGVDPEKAQAKARVVALLKEAGDPRAKQFE